MTVVIYVSNIFVLHIIHTMYNRTRRHWLLYVRQVIMTSIFVKLEFKYYVLKHTAIFLLTFYSLYLLDDKYGIYDGTLFTYKYIMMCIGQND